MNAFLQDKTHYNQSPFQVKQVLSSICNDTEQLFQVQLLSTGEYWNLINWSINVVSYAQIALQSMYFQVGTQCSPKCAFSTWIVSLITGISCLQQLAILFRGRDLFQHIVFCTYIHYESHIHSNKSKPSWYTVFAISTH